MAKKTMSKKRAAAKKKAAAKKSRKKSPAKAAKKKVAKKPAARKSKKAAAKKKPAKKASKKKPAKKKASKKKAGKKKATKKKVAKKKTTKKKSAKKTKKPAAKKPAKRKAAKKPSAKKKPAKKAAAKKSVSKKAAAKTQRPAPKAKPKRKTGKTATAVRRSNAVLSGPLHGFTPYQRDRGEGYMNDEQLDHFRNILEAWKQELMEEVDRTVLHMKDEAANFPDPNDRATQESEFGLELRTRDRERKLLRKIGQAIQRIDDGSYGYCEETGEEIGLKRLEARPVATLCVEAQERRELAERQFRDRDDRYR